MAYRVVIHGIPSRVAARRLAMEIAAAAEGWEPALTIEPDDVDTAKRPGGARVELVSLRKDTEAAE